MNRRRLGKNIPNGPCGQGLFGVHFLAAIGQGLGLEQGRNILYNPHMKPFLFFLPFLFSGFVFSGCRSTVDTSPLTASQVHLVFINSEPKDFFGSQTASLYGIFPAKGLQTAVRKYWKRTLDVSALEAAWVSSEGKALPHVSSGFSRIYTLDAKLPAGTKTLTLTIELLPSAPDLWEVRLLISRSMDETTLEFVLGEAGNPAGLEARLKEFNQSMGNK